VSALDVLAERGFVQDTSDEVRLRAALERPISVYCGYDPTRDSLTVGHLLSIMMLSHLQRAGHRPIALLGGGTTMIGDPTGKTEMREMLSREEIDRNAVAVKGQFERFINFDGDRALLLNNADWLLKLGYVEFLRDIGRHFSVNHLLQHETYRERLAGDGLNFIELNYALLQAYDFLHLHREHGCVLQIGGSDQWFNILAGVELIRRVEGAQAFALVSPLLMTSSGAKMGKTESGAVWLDARRTSPYEFYQFWVRTEDADVGRFLRLFTFLPLEEIAELERLSGAELNRAKERLAIEVTGMVHGAEAAKAARAASRAAFGGGRDAAALEHIPTTAVARVELERGLALAEALERSGLATSRGDAKRQVQGGGIYVNDRRVERLDVVLTLADLDGGQALLRKGKKQYHRLVVTE
jgi:tyrosyl-tRNA synthetase